MSISAISSTGGGYDHMSIEQMRQKIFKTWDTNGDGSIDNSEAQTAAATMSQDTGLSITADQIMSIFDTDQNGSISQTEFTQASSTWEDHMKNLMDAAGMSSMGPPPPPQDSNAVSQLSNLADQIFAAMDTDGDGTISQTEFEAAMQQLTGQSISSTASSTTTDSSTSTSSSSTTASTSTDSTGSSESNSLAALLQQFLDLLAKLQDDQYSQYSQNSQTSQDYQSTNAYV